MQADVIVVGAGFAGMMAAIAAARQNARVILVDRNFIGLGTNTALAAGAFNAPVAGYTRQTFIAETLKVGKMINHLPSVELVAGQADESFAFLKSLGVNLEPLPTGFKLKAPRIDIIAGVYLVRLLAQETNQPPRITALPGFQVEEILKKDNACLGVRGMDRRGNTVSILAPAVVLATGGAGAIYQRTDNQRSILGQGYYLAAQAGLELWDMEFVQFYPLVFSEPTLASFIVYPSYPKETRIINASGEDLLAKHGIPDLNEATRKNRDEMAKMVRQEEQDQPVYLDFTKLPPEAWERYPGAFLQRLKFDFKSKPVRISAGAHFFMGGVRADQSGQTELPGLFACGEVVWGLHGANRRGGNAFTECLVCGRLAGLGAASYARQNRGFPQEDRPSPLAFAPKPSSPKIGLKALRTQLREIAYEHAGIIRSQKGLEQGMAKLEELEENLAAAGYLSPAEYKLRHDLLGAAFVLKSILTASLARQESRGSFYRQDLPGEDNQNWRKNSCLSYNPASKAFSLAHRQPSPMYPGERETHSG